MRFCAIPYFAHRALLEWKLEYIYTYIYDNGSCKDPGFDLNLKVTFTVNQMATQHLVGHAIGH